MSLWSRNARTALQARHTHTQILKPRTRATSPLSTGKEAFDYKRTQEEKVGTSFGDFLNASSRYDPLPFPQLRPSYHCLCEDLNLKIPSVKSGAWLVDNDNIDEEALTARLAGLVRSGRSRKALKELESIYKVERTFSFMKQWRIVFRGLADRGDVPPLLSGLVFLFRLCLLPDSTLYRAFFEGIKNSRWVSDWRGAVLSAIEGMEINRVAYDKDTHRILAELAQRDDALLEAAIAYASRRSQRQVTMVVSKERKGAWIKELVSAFSKGPRIFGICLQRIRAQGFPISPTSFTHFIATTKISTANELRYIRRQFGLEKEKCRRAWVFCIYHAVGKGGWEQALEVYEVAKSEGFEPDGETMTLIIQQMLRVPVKELSDQLVDRALHLFDSLGDKADSRLCGMLVRAAASSKNTTKYYPIAMRIFNMMQARGFRMDVDSTIAYAVLLIRSANNFIEMQEAYERIRKISDPPLHSKGLYAVLHAFCMFEARKSHLKVTSGAGIEYECMHLSIPPAPTYFEIIKDMRKRGILLQSREYSILLVRYAKLATRARNMPDPSQRAVVIEAVRTDIGEIHRRIAIDAELKLDAVLLNSLMDAYNRVDALPEVMRIWAWVIAKGQVTHAGVSIIFDACGHGRSLSRAYAVFEELQRMGWKMNVGNWNAWVECLCRLERFEEAANVVSEEMWASDVRPNDETRMLLESFGVGAKPNLPAQTK